MDDKEKKIRDGLLHIAKLHGPVMILDGTVLAVDEENYFVDVDFDTEGIQYECRLRAASVGNKSIDILPTVGSAIVVAKIASDDYIMLACDEIDDIRITAAGFELQLNQTGIAISNGGDSLKQILSDLIDQIQSIYAPKDVGAISGW